MKLFRDRAAANHFAAFQNDRLKAALGQVEGGDQSVVTAANEDYFLSERHGQFLASAGA